MRRLAHVVILAVVLLSITGCGPKPVNVVKEYLKCCCSHDVGKAKSLCTGDARRAIGDIHEELMVDRVMAAGADDQASSEHPGWEEIESKLLFNIEGMDEFNAVVTVQTPEQVVTFKLLKVKSKWMISGISNPQFGLSMSGMNAL